VSQDCTLVWYNKYGILLIRKHVCRTVPKSGVMMGGGISRGEVRQKMEKFPAMATKVVLVSL
jgi:lipoate synthase